MEGKTGLQVREDILFHQAVLSNVVFLGRPGLKDWVLVDAGIRSAGNDIEAIAEERYGEGVPPAAIVLTHGHFDHIGSLEDLLERWNVPVYAHRLELPYLTGQKDYPRPDPSVGGGMMSAVSFLYPNEAINLGERVKALPDDGQAGFLAGWRVVHTPGHTPGHISLFRETDRVLISGDAFITVDQESAVAVMTQEKEVNGPPAYFTTDWDQARESVRKLAALKPRLVLAGHGQPMEGEKLEQELSRLASDFDHLAVPDRGRYVHRDARPNG